MASISRIPVFKDTASPEEPSHTIEAEVITDKDSSWFVYRPYGVSHIVSCVVQPPMSDQQASALREVDGVLDVSQPRENFVVGPFTSIVAYPNTEEILGTISLQNVVANVILKND